MHIHATRRGEGEESKEIPVVLFFRAVKRNCFRAIASVRVAGAEQSGAEQERSRAVSLLNLLGNAIKSLTVVFKLTNTRNNLQVKSRRYDRRVYKIRFIVIHINGTRSIGRLLISF